MTDNIIPFSDPNRNPVQDELLRAHDDEAARLGVEFTNYGWASDEDGILPLQTSRASLIRFLGGNNDACSQKPSP